MTVRRKLLAVAALLALLLAAGCGKGDSTPMAAETDEPAFRLGQQRLREGRVPEALTWFLKVIEKRGLQNAPESHLEAGQIYLQHSKNPNYAYYHFSKYLELQPNSQQAPLVRQQVSAALREFAATLPLRPEENQVRFENAEELARLKRENEELKAKVATLQGGGGVPLNRSNRALATPDVSRPVLAAPAEQAPITAVPIAPPRPPIQAASVQRPPPAAPTRSPAAGKSHTVQQSEGLFAIARRYDAVNTSRKLQEILGANPDVLPNGVNTPLKPGMVLRIP